MTSLYLLVDEYRQAAKLVSDMDASDEAIANTLDDLAYPIQEKATNIAQMVRNLEATAEAIKAAETEMAKRRKALEARAEGVREYLRDNMIRAGISKIESPYFSLAIRDNPPAVVIDAESLIPAEFMRKPEPPPATPDKKAIAEEIKAGRDVTGAHLARTQRIEIK